MALALNSYDTKFIEGAFLVMLGVLGGLLKASASPQTTVQAEGSTTNVTMGEEKK